MVLLSTFIRGDHASLSHLSIDGEREKCTSCVLQPSKCVSEHNQYEGTVHILALSIAKDNDDIDGHGMHTNIISYLTMHFYPLFPNKILTPNIIHQLNKPNRYVNLTGSSNIGTISNLILGCMAEWAHLPVTLPIDCVTTAIQTDDQNRGAFVLLGNILSEKGIGGFYKGIQAYTVLCLKPAIQYTVYEQVKKMVLATRNAGRKVVDESLSAAEAFFLGMVARIVATMLTYPYLRAKVMLQSTYGNAKVKPTIPQMISEQISEGGVWGLYQGIGPELTRGVFSAALMMMVKERIGVIVRGLIDGREQQQGGNHGR